MMRSECVSVVFHSFLIVAPIICGGGGGVVFGPCFVVHYLVSCLVLQLSRWGRESWLLKNALKCH